MATPDFSEFKQTSSREWREKIATDLKGKPYESLISETLEGIAIRPDYHPDDISVHAPVTGQTGWMINRVFDAANPETANQRILESLQQGITSITLKNINSEDLGAVLKDVLIEHIGFRFAPHSSDKLPGAFYAYCDKHAIDPSTLRGTLGMLPAPSHRKDLIPAYRDQHSGLALFTVDAGTAKNKGADCVTELAMGLSAGHDALLGLLEDGMAAKDAAAAIEFSFATGTDYFTEIAKYRAFRILWRTILREYDAGDTMRIHASGSPWNFTVFDRHTNLLRATTQTMAAAIGGCDCITTLPFNLPDNPDDETGERLAKNIQLLLKEETFLDKTADPAAGSWYIEYLTGQLAAKAWDAFRECEKAGGYFKVPGFFDKRIENARQRQLEAVREGRQTILGVNKYPNPKESPEELIRSVKNDFDRLSSELENEAAKQEKS